MLWKHPFTNYSMSQSTHTSLLVDTDGQLLLLSLEDEAEQHNDPTNNSLQSISCGQKGAGWAGGRGVGLGGDSRLQEI